MIRQQSASVGATMTGYTVGLAGNPAPSPARMSRMNYLGKPDFDHATPPRVGVLLTNLGTPDAPTKAALKPYLKQFLSDPRVVEIPRLVWWFILNGIILRVRPARSAEAYTEVWTERGSPLLFHLEDQVAGVRAALAPEWGDQLLVRGAMRYGNPSIPSVLGEMLDAGVRRLVVMPLYPQYSAATTASTFDELSNDLQRRRWLPDLRFLSCYHDDPGYIEAIARSVETHWQQHGRAERLVLSYHGMPVRYLLNGDPYHCQCHKTSRLVARRLGLADDAYITTVQARFGREEWLKPYTDDTLKALPDQGIRSVQVVCPGFSADCLETIEEIGMENRDYFMEAGGERYEYIPCLNASPDHIDVIADLLRRELAGWDGQTGNAIETKTLALALGADR